MVQRSYTPEAPAENIGRTIIQDVQLQREAPDSRRIQNSLRGRSTADTILDAVLPIAQQGAQQAFQNQTEAAYLDGVAQFSQGVSESELQTNPITRNFTTAGYRDTEGRVAVAEAQAQLASEMPRLASLPADAEGGFNQFAAKQRTELAAKLEGMSRQQRAAMFMQLANDQVAATKKYTAARTEYVLKQEQKSIELGMTARRDNLELAATMADRTVYAAEVDSLTEYLYGAIWQNPKLPEATKVQMMEQAAEYFASGDHTAVYRDLRSREFTFPDGSTGTLWSRLPHDSQIKIDGHHRKAENRVKDIRAAEFAITRANDEVLWSEGEFNKTYEEVEQDGLRALQAGLISADGLRSYLNSYLSAQAKFGSDDRLANVYSAGDTGGRIRMGKSTLEGAQAYTRAAIRAGKAPEQVVAEHMAIGASTGQAASFTVVGEMLSPAIGQLGLSKEIDPTNAAMVSNVLKALEITERDAPGARVALLQGLPDDQQDFLELFSQTLKDRTSDPMDAAEHVRQVMAGEATSVGQARRVEVQRENAALVGEITERGLWSSGWGSIKGAFSGDARTMHDLREFRTWFQNEDRVEEAMGLRRYAFAEELERIGRASPWLTASSRKSRALAALNNRTVDTDHGTMLLPVGATVQTAFGVPASADADYVGAAIGDLYKPSTDGGSLVYEVAPGTGAIKVREYDSDGNSLPAYTVNPQAVRDKVQENLERDSKKADREVGRGQRVAGASGNPVRVNGLNTAGVTAPEMLSLRRALVQHEDVKLGDYPDTVGVQTFGVGISTKSDHWEEPDLPGGVRSGAQIRRTFAAASDDAANVATAAMERAGVQGREAFLLLGDLAYQSPRSARNSDLLAAMSVGDIKRAEEALKKTPAWKHAGEGRREWRLRQLRKSME